ncbi:MAG: hypothetical protein ACU843_16540 [Gammaproteobacteria bacterium]
MMVVEPSSADPGITGVNPVTIDADHLTTCKHASKDEIVYRGVKRFLEQTLLPGRIDPECRPISASAIK